MEIDLNIHFRLMIMEFIILYNNVLVSFDKSAFLRSILDAAKNMNWDAFLGLTIKFLLLRSYNSCAHCCSLVNE